MASRLSEFSQQVHMAGEEDGMPRKIQELDRDGSMIEIFRGGYERVHAACWRVACTRWSRSDAYRRI